MFKEEIINLSNQWKELSNELIHEKEINIQKTEDALREIYRICTIYYDNDVALKKMCEGFTDIDKYLDYVLNVYNIDAYSSSSDTAEYDAIGYIVDEIKFGFYNGGYKNKYPKLQVDDSNGNSHILDMEGDFLELLIDANR